ncbi:hypothetical protein DCAR_0831606 [Daucus carota subsp. sativus]|uniref:DUF4378 domain-containing protein n=1 Tax=Daucus carota subsp. sativus TaxID=79200 RepID=A0AAF0XRS4_DAUCS|nr:hypothetical protein DCAR_0831606 [Daucus carota subsp. sativus]
MGFDGLKSKQPIHSQHRSFVEHNLQKTLPVARQEEPHLVDRKSYKKRYTEPSEHRSIFEAKSSPNRDAILELMKNPNPLFVKHLKDVQESNPRCVCRHLIISKQSKPEKYQAKEQNVHGSTSKRHNIDLKQAYEKSILARSSILASTQNCPKLSKIRGEEKDTSGIVIWKPDYRMAQDANNCFSSHDTLGANISRSRKSEVKMSDWRNNEDFLETLDLVDGVAASASRVRGTKKTGKKVVKELREPSQTMKGIESKVAAKRFSGEVQEAFSPIRTDFPSCVKEIPGTGRLHNLSGIDITSPAEVIRMTYYNSTESFIRRQAKKRLLERRRRAQRYQHGRTGGMGSTFGEMKNLKAASARLDGPLVISSADGRKECLDIKPRSISLPPPGTRNVKLNAECEHRTGNKLLTFKEDRYRRQSKVHGSFNEKQELSFKTSRSSNINSKSWHRSASNSHALLENHIDEVDLLKKDSLEEKTMAPPTTTATRTIGTGASTIPEYLTAVSPSSNKCYSDSSRSVLKQCVSFHGAQKHSNSKHLFSLSISLLLDYNFLVVYVSLCFAFTLIYINKRSLYGPAKKVSILQLLAGSSGSSKEADPNPILALEVPSREDVSSGPECSIQVTTDLLDLGEQLSLLSRESKSGCDDSPGERSRLALDANELGGSECWESFYIADVLTECDLYDMDTDALIPSLNGPNHPLGPWVFHKLETTYCDEPSAPKYERMLLFDRIRSAVLEISQSCMNQLCPWVKVSAELGLKSPKCKLRDELLKLLAIQDAEVIELISGKVIDKVTSWGDLKNSIDMIAKIIERSLTNDLLMELVTELQLDE